MIGEWTQDRNILEDDTKTQSISDYLWSKPLFRSWWNLRAGVPGERFQRDADGQPVTARVTEGVTAAVTDETRPVVMELIDPLVCRWLKRVWAKVNELGVMDGDDAVVDYAGLKNLDTWARVPHFGAAMAAVGWAVAAQGDGGVPCLRFPKFLRHNRPAESRGGRKKYADKAEKQRAYRERKKAAEAAEFLASITGGVTDHVTPPGNARDASPSTPGVTGDGNGATARDRTGQDRTGQDSQLPPNPPPGGGGGGGDDERFGPSGQDGEVTVSTKLPKVTLAPHLNTPEVKAAWAEYEQHCIDARKPLTKSARHQNAERLNLAKTPAEAVAMIRQTTGNPSYYEIRPLRRNEHGPHAGTGRPHDPARPPSTPGKYAGRGQTSESFTAALRARGAADGGDADAPAEVPGREPAAAVAAGCDF